jgi:tetratricopeptide (TPR) repeat protein
MARSIVFRYKGKQVDPQEVGQELNVRAVVTGKVFQVADRLVIAAELVDVADGSQLWGEQYNRKPADIFAVQEEISREIIEKLRLRLSGEQKKRLAKRNTEDPEAYQLYLKGRYYWNKRSAEGLKKAVECFQQGIDKDPNYAQAYAGMADCYSSLGTYSVLAPRDTFPKAKAAALKALALDDSLAEAHLALAFVLHLFEWDWSDAEKKFKRALQLNPANAETHHWYAWYLMRVGQVKEGLAEMKLAQEMDVLSLPINSSLGTAFFYAREYDRAVEQLLKALEMDPNFAEAHRALGETYQARAQYDDAIAEYQRASILSGGSAPIVAHLGNVYAAAGKKGEARKLLSELQQLGKRTYVSAYDMASIHVGFGDREQAFEWLEMAYGERSYLLAEIKNDPRMDSLRSDPRFIDLLRRIGLQP